MSTDLTLSDNVAGIVSVTSVFGNYNNVLELSVVAFTYCGTGKCEPALTERSWAIFEYTSELLLTEMARSAQAPTSIRTRLTAVA